MRLSTTYDATITLDNGEGCVECPAEFDIEGDEYSAEQHSWGWSRGNENLAKAELISAMLGNLKLDRGQCVSATGAEHVAWQENRVAEQYLQAISVGDAA